MHIQPIRLHSLSLLPLALPLMPSALPPMPTALPPAPGVPLGEEAGAPAAGADTTAEARRLEELRAELYELLGPEAPAATPSAAQSDAPTVSIGSGGFRVRSGDGEYEIRIGGRLQTDANFHDGEGALDPMITDGTELRRARFELKGRLPDDMSWAAEVDLANNSTKVKDFWLGFETDAGPEVFFGHQKQPYSLDIEMSSNDIPFVERGIDSFLITPFVDRAVGVRVQDSTDSIFYAAGLYGEGVSPNAVDDEGWGLAGRFVVAPVRSETEVVHLGARAAFRQPEDGAQTVRIDDETTNMSNFAVVDTGAITGVDSVFVYGAEAAWARGPFSIGGEVNQLTVDAPGGDLDFQSWHVQTTWSLTGESRAAAYRLDAGEFKRLHAEEPGDHPWELAARLASLDLEDGAVAGGEEQAFSLALNCYYSSNLRLMWNWTNILSTDGGSAATDAAEGLDIFTFRAQLTF